MVKKKHRPDYQCEIQIFKTVFTLPCYVSYIKKDAKYQIDNLIWFSYMKQVA